MSSRKKGWKTVSSTRGARPKPLGARQKTSVSQVVMVSGTVRGTSADPEVRVQTESHQVYNGVGLISTPFVVPNAFKLYLTRDTH